MEPRTLAELNDFTAGACRDTTPAEIEDWSPAERDLVLVRLYEAVREETTLAERLRLAVSMPCDAPPDLHGQCPLCGRKMADPVSYDWHSPGCSPFAFAVGGVMRVRRFVVRVARLVRVLWAAARYSSGHWP